jgi:tetratricopeptide (TPR) repeat protein
MRVRPWRRPTESRECKKRRAGLALRAGKGDDTPEVKEIKARFDRLPLGASRRARLAAARAVIAANPRGTRGYMLEAFAWREHPGAVRAYTRLAALERNSPTGWFLRAEARMTLRDWRRAEPDLTRALALDKGYYRESAYLLRAACYWQLGRFDEALADCAKVADACWFRFFAGFISLNRRMIVAAIERACANPSG